MGKDEGSTAVWKFLSGNSEHFYTIRTVTKGDNPVKHAGKQRKETIAVFLNWIGLTPDGTSGPQPLSFYQSGTTNITANGWKGL
mgnify:CR=1 FL=1